MGRKLKNSDRGTAKFIRIADESKWEVIDKLFVLEKFKSNFNKLINDALDYGLPKLYEAEFGEVEIEKSVPQKTDNLFNEFNFKKTLKLLNEIVINETINKSILCSVFHILSVAYKGTSIGKKFEDGDFKYTPNYLESFEMRALSDLVQQEEDDD